MAPDKVRTIIVACAVLHNMVIVWKQPMLENSTIDHHTFIMEEQFELDILLQSTRVCYSYFS